MRLWMIAERAVWERLQRDGCLRVDPARTEHDFRLAYDWMRRQMALRIPGYRGGYPWWAWIQWDPARARPDLRARENHYFAPGTPCVRLELELPDAEVLASDFDLWHCVLNNSYLGWSEAEDQWWNCLPAAERSREALERSWERIFALDHPQADPAWLGTVRAERIQGVFEMLRARDVVRVTAFVSRPVRWPGAISSDRPQR